MRKNVYTKSMLRQPLHSLILVFLLFMATFSFVLRSVEFLTVREQIFSIASFYRSIGFLSGEDEYYDVNLGADFLENSRYIEFVDRRRGVEGILQGMLNADIGLSRFHRDAFFYGELIDKIAHPNPADGWRLILAVDDVVVGYPEHVVTGQEILQLDFDMDFQMMLQMAYDGEEGDEAAIANMEIGERYFLRGAFHGAPSDLDDIFSFTVRPSVGNERNVLNMRALNPSELLWYVPVPYGETIDFTMPEFARILEEVEFLERQRYALQLRTTKDMALIPFMLEDAEMGYIADGRPIDQEDYLNANPVAVINNLFAQIRDLSIGDTITVNIPQAHYAEFEISMGYYTNTGLAEFFHEVSIESVPQDAGAHEIELTIVGIYNQFQLIPGSYSTDITRFIYIPDSVLPDTVITSSNIGNNPETEAYLPSIWYSFMLECSRYEDAFVAEVRLPLEEMGLTVTMIDSGAENFWESANIILQSITFNGIVFSVVLILVLMLVTFLFLRKRHKEFAVSRMLGHSISRSVKEVMLAALLFLVPIVIGSIFAWMFARHTIENSLQNLDEFRPYEEAEAMTAVERFEAVTSGYEVYEAYEAYDVAFSLSLYPLIALVTVVFVLKMLMVFIGALRLTRRPVLELLQCKG